MNYFFFPLTELAFWIMLGVSQIIRQISPESVQTLLLPDHPRVRDRFDDIIASQFDRVVNLPYVSYMVNLIEGYRRTREFVQCLKGIDFPKQSIVFGCGWSGLVHFILGRYIKKLGTPNPRLLVSLQACIGVDLLANGSKVDLRQTILKSAYTIPLAGEFTWSYREPTTGVYVWSSFCRQLDVLVNIEHSSPADGTLVFDELPFPTRFLSPRQIRSRHPVELDDNALLVLLDSTLPAYGMCDEDQYWKGANELIEALRNGYPKCKIYVKLHPQSEDVYLDRIDNVQVGVIDKRTAAEEVYLFNRQRILGVFSGSSTALITARWFGISSYDCSEVFGIDSEYLEHFFKVYSKHAEGIIKVNRVSDLRTDENDVVHVNAGIRDPYAPPDVIDEWHTLIKALNDLVRSRSISKYLC